MEGLTHTLSAMGKKIEYSFFATHYGCFKNKSFSSAWRSPAESTGWWSENEMFSFRSDELELRSTKHAYIVFGSWHVKKEWAWVFSHKWRWLARLKHSVNRMHENWLWHTARTWLGWLYLLCWRWARARATLLRWDKNNWNWPAVWPTCSLLTKLQIVFDQC